MILVANGTLVANVKAYHRKFIGFKESRESPCFQRKDWRIAVVGLTGGYS